TSYGLNWLDKTEAVKTEPVFKKLTTTNGLPNNTIHAIEEDRTGQIWVSTNKGLARLDPNNLNISYYQHSDGLQSNEFGDGAVWKDRQDNLFFGGTYGFNNFLPQNITKSSWIPNLIAEGISFGAKKTAENNFFILKPQSDHAPLHYIIDRNENFFELNIKALSFLNSEKSEFAYYLDGYNKEWYYAGKNGKLNFSNILPGTYTLKVKWSNGDGLWTEDLSFLTLEVNQYPWLTTYAWLGYFSILTILGILFYRYRKNKLEIRHQLEVEHLLRKKEEELHKNRLGFFTNIAHELQTPLTLIMGASERQKEMTGTEKTKSGISYFPTLIHQQAAKLTYLVQQLLEFRKVEAGFLKNQFNHTNISDFLYNLTEPFMVLSEQLNNSFTPEIEKNMLGWIDKDKTEKIIYNLLSNAFKYSGKQEQIQFSSTINKENKTLELLVANSGVEMNEEQINKLFEQFYSVSTAHSKADRFGTGIGLAFTRQLVHMVRGTIIAESKEGWIHFTVTLPISGENMEAKEYQQDNSTNEQPSYLYKTITNYSEIEHPESALENNKEALVENLLNDEKKKILIVEDEAEIRYLLKDILKNDYIIYEAEDGKSAIELIEKVMPSLIICDVMMPHMNGLELCHTVKETVSTCQIPFVLLSARGGEEQHMEGYEVGADAYIEKPFNATHLKIRVRKLLEYREKLHQVFFNDQDNEVNFSTATGIEDADKAFLTSVLKLIEENIASEELNAALLEKEFFMSKMQLYRKLKTLTNMTPGEFIKSIRLKRTANLLLTTNLNVLEIFYQTGFNNQSYFFREFKKRYRCSPNEYREQNQLIE
ncbi:MAG: response regulator, partial [Ginsengibacter sp.]